MMKKLLKGHAMSKLALLAASMLQLIQSQTVTELNLYGNSNPPATTIPTPPTFPTFPHIIISQVASPTDYSYRPTSIAFYSDTTNQYIVKIVVNGQDNYATSVTSGPCQAQQLFLTPIIICTQCPSYFTNPLVLTATAKVNWIEPRYDDSPAFANMVRVTIQIIDRGANTMYSYGKTVSSFSKYKWIHPTSTQVEEFVGFKMGLPSTSEGGPTCKFTGLSIYLRPDICATVSVTEIDVSSFNSGMSILVFDATKSFNLNSTTNGSTTCTVSYKITVTGPNSNLITLSDNTVTFAASNVLSDAGEYSIAVQAIIYGRNSWSAATTATFTYVNPCVSATIPAIVIYPTTFSVNVGESHTSPTFAVFQDSVTTAVNNGTIICAQTVSQYVASDPTPSANQTMYAKFTYATTSSTSTAGTQTISASPTLLDELGIYNLFLVVCVTENPSSCVQCSMVVNVKTKPPYFIDVLPNQIIDICSSQQTKLWKFIIPSPIDPNGGPVIMKVNLNSGYFSFNEQTNTIEQKQEQKVAVNQTIDIKLFNEFNASSTYSMKVEFKCKVDQNLNETTTNQTSNSSLKKQNNWPLAYIKTIDGDGLMHIAFRQRMKIHDNITEIQNGTVRINDTDYPNLLITVIPGQLSDRKLLQFTSQVINFTESELTIQLSFQNLQQVSFHNQHKEQIQVQIYGGRLFEDTHKNKMLPGTILQPVYLPCLNTATAIEQAKEVASYAKTAMNSVMLANFVSSFFIAQPLQQLLGSIRHLQIIIHSMLLNLSYPSTANVCFGELMNILTFQVYSFFDVYNKILGLDPNGDGNNPYNIQFNAMGYGAMYIIQNFGMLCLTIFITPVLYVLVLLLHLCFPKEMDKSKISLHRQLFYGSWIKLINETYLFLGVCAAINCQYLKFETYGNVINSLCAVFCALVIIVFPLFVVIFYNLPKNYQKVLNRDEDFMARYGQILEGLNFLRMGQKDTLYPFFSFLRKLSLVYVVIYMQNKPVFSLFTLIYQAIIMITLVGYIPPFKSRLENQLELVNETFVLLVTYQLFTFTDFLSDAPTREYVGYSLVVTTLVCIFINFSVVGLIMASICISNLKRSFYQCRHSRAVNSIKKNREKKQKLEAERIKKAEKKQRKQENAQKEQQKNVKARITTIQQKQIMLELQQSIPTRQERIREAQRNKKLKEQQHITIVDQIEEQIVEKTKLNVVKPNHLQGQGQTKQRIKSNHNLQKLLFKEDQTVNLQRDASAKHIKNQNQPRKTDFQIQVKHQQFKQNDNHRRDKEMAYSQQQQQEEIKVPIENLSKPKTQQRQPHHFNNFSFDGSSQFNLAAANNMISNQQEILLDHSYRDQYYANQQQEQSQAKDFKSRNNQSHINKQFQNFSLDNRQLVAAKPKNVNNPTFGEKILQNLTLAPTAQLKTFSSPAEAQLYNQKIGSNQTYFYTNEFGQQFQCLFPYEAVPAPSTIQEDLLSQLPVALQGLTFERRKTFKEIFGNVPAHIQLDLAYLFSQMDDKKPLNYREFLNKLAQICYFQQRLFDQAMYWSEHNSENAKFAQDERIDFESAVDYRSGMIPNIVRRCVELQNQNDILISVGLYEKFSYLKKSAFDELPVYENIKRSVAGNVYWYKALLKSEKIRNLYPELFE